LDGSEYPMKIDQSTRAHEVVHKIASKLELHYFEDFRLFLKD